MLSIAIVIPSWHYWADPTRIQPLHEMHYATVLENRFKKRGVSVSIIDLRGITLDQQVRHVPEHDLYIYWIMKSCDYTETEFLVKELRKYYPKSKHAAGGTHVDMCPDECRAFFDAIVVGPGEESFTKMIEDYLKGGLEGKEYKTEYKFVKFGDYPFMRRHFLPKTAVVNSRLFQKYGYDIDGTCVLFSRGCNLHCAYCVYNIPNAIQMKPLETIAEEIQYLKKEYGVKAINLKDEIALPFSPKTCLPYLETIGNANIMWRGQTTVWGATEEHIKLAADSGCVELATGIESASELVRDVVRKKMTDVEIKTFINNCHKYNIKVKMCLILGLPGESMDIVEKTIKFIEESGPDYVAVSGFNPFPGSPIYNDMKYFGIKSIDKNWDKHAHLLFRFGNKEDVGLPFEYEKESQWGKTFTRKEIVDNICTVQEYLRERSMTY